MLTTTKLLSRIFVIVTAFAISACAATTTRLPSIPGANTTSVVLYLHKDGSGATLSGHVDVGTEKALIERYVRAEYGFASVINLISIP